jgi:hypothetical protein
VGRGPFSEVMNPIVQLAIEAACLIGIIVLAAVCSRILGGKELDRSMRLRLAGVVIISLAYLFVNPRGGANPFPVVIWGTVFVVVLLGLVVAIALGWRWVYRDRARGGDKQTALNFSYVVIYALFVVTCLAGVVLGSVGTVETLATRSAYERAPVCASAPAYGCRSQSDGQVIQTWADSPRGHHWIEVSVLGRNKTIEVTTAIDVWRKLAPGTRVALSSWQGLVTEVTLPGVGTMQAVDSPGSDLIAAVGLLAASGVGFVLFSAAGIVYWLKWRLALRGIDPSQVAA